MFREISANLLIPRRKIVVWSCQGELVGPPGREGSAPSSSEQSGVTDPARPLPHHPGTPPVPRSSHFASSVLSMGVGLREALGEFSAQGCPPHQRCPLPGQPPSMHKACRSLQEPAGLQKSRGPLTCREPGPAGQGQRRVPGPTLPLGAR